MSTQLMPHATAGESHPLEQTPPLQKGVGAAQVVVQEPQVAPLERSDSQPLAGSPSQSAKPWMQAKPHEAPSQVGVAFGRVEQGVHELPQLDGLWSSTHASSHACEPGAQGSAPVLVVSLELEVEVERHDSRRAPLRSGLARVRGSVCRRP